MLHFGFSCYKFPQFNYPGPSLVQEWGRCTWVMVNVHVRVSKWVKERKEEREHTVLATKSCTKPNTPCMGLLIFAIHGTWHQFFFPLPSPISNLSCSKAQRNWIIRVITLYISILAKILAYLLWQEFIGPHDICKPLCVTKQHINILIYLFI